MLKIYLVLFFVTGVCGAYFVGIRVGYEKCMANTANNTVAQYANIIQLQENVNAQVLDRGVDDIRRILREKYTIAE